MYDCEFTFSKVNNLIAEEADTKAYVLLPFLIMEVLKAKVNGRAVRLRACENGLNPVQSQQTSQPCYSNLLP